MSQAIDSISPIVAPVVPNASPTTHSRWLPAFLRPQTPPAPITDPAEIQRQYAFFRPRVLLWSTIGYGMFYFVRRNFDAVMPVIGQRLGISKEWLGLILTLHGGIYGVSKFFNGMAADRADARKFMSLALIICAGLNIAFGLSTSVIAFGLLWMLNGWFQGMGYPPCARLLTHWFAPRELATKMALWNISHTLGGGLIIILCGYLLQYSDNNWRLCFFIPAGLAILTAVLMLKNLRDTPESVGLPEVEGTAAVDELEANAGKSDAEFKLFIRQRVFKNKYIWFVAFANFFVYTIRFAIFSWGTTLLQEYKHISLLHSAFVVAGFEFAGMAGMLLMGWMTDRYFRGRGAPLSLICMLLSAVALLAFWQLPTSMNGLSLAILISAGFLIYGPQTLVAVIVAHLATKRGTATAVGLISIFAYASTIVSGFGLGWMSQHYGWGAVFAMLIGVALVGAGLFALLLPAASHGQKA